MTDAEDLDKLKDARDKIGEVLENQIKDEVYDNGNLDHMIGAVKHLENSISIIQTRIL